MGALGNLSTASGSSEDGRTELQIGLRDIFFHTPCAFFGIHSSHILPLFVCVISFSSYAQVFEIALVQSYTFPMGTLKVRAPLAQPH